MRFLTRYDGEVSEPLVGRQGSRAQVSQARTKMELRGAKPEERKLQGTEEQAGDFSMPRKEDSSPETALLVQFRKKKSGCPIYLQPLSTL